MAQTLERTIDPREIKHLVIAGWTGRNVEALEKHILELEALGVKRPKSTPIFYRVSADLLTTKPSIEVLGTGSTGEVEFVLFSLADGLWVGLGSDHTDRKAETIGVSLSKQMCAKPIAATAWRYDDVRAHWDQLMLRSDVRRGGERQLYQEGFVASMRTPDELIKLYTRDATLPVGTAMFCGTLAVHGNIAFADRFEMELNDPVLGRRISHAYTISKLPDEG
ncbi:MAG: DUF2848 domain-containing protein [Xanthobacteraceae bacterium]